MNKPQERVVARPRCSQDRNLHESRHPKAGRESYVKSAVLHTIALAHYAIVFARTWPGDSINARVRLASENDRRHEECALAREGRRLKDQRITLIPPQRRPHYSSTSA